jgi:hypothetical protein
MQTSQGSGKPMRIHFIPLKLCNGRPRVIGLWATGNVPATTPSQWVFRYDAPCRLRRLAPTSRLHV